MKVKEGRIDELVYVIACVLSLGAIWVTRVVISVAIRKAVQDN